MRVMVIVKASEDSEAGILPDEKLSAAMGRFNEDLVKAGVMLAAETLHPSSKGVRVRSAAGARSVIDGPSSDARGLVACFWLWQVRSLDEALEWVKRCPDPVAGTESEIEIRQVFEADDLGAVDSPERGTPEERVHARVAAHQ